MTAPDPPAPETRARDEAFDLAILGLYQAAFGRPPDRDGASYFRRRLNDGVGLLDLARTLTETDEFRRRHGGRTLADPEFVAAAYADALGRPPERRESARWLEHDGGAAERAEVLVALAGTAKARARGRLLSGLREGKAPDDPDAYHAWVQAVDALDDAERDAVRDRVAWMTRRPTVSLVVAAGDAPDALLYRTAEAVVAQLYPEWELLVALDATSRPGLYAQVRALARADARVRALAVRAEQPAAAANIALQSSGGEFACLLEPGDVLAEHALYEIAVAARPGVHLVFADEDEMDGAGRRANPRFKPGWNPALLHAMDCVGRPAAYRRRVAERAGWLRPLPPGVAAHELALRVTAALAPGAVRHVPAVLLHRAPAPPPSPAQAVEHRAMLRAHLEVEGAAAGARVCAAPDEPTAARVVYPLPHPVPLVSAIVPTRDRADLLRPCAEGLLRGTDYPAIELLVVDNGSEEAETFALFDELRADPRVRVHPYPGPFNWSAMNNEAARFARGGVLLLLNNDVAVLRPDWLRELVSHAVRPEVGVVGAKLLYPDLTLQHGGIALGPDARVTHLLRGAGRHDPGYLGQLATARNLSAVTGACLAVRKEVFQEAGGLEETNLRVTWSDVDLCLRVQALGYHVVWTPHAELLHKELATRGSDDSSDKAARYRAEQDYMRRRWGERMERDPYLDAHLRATETALVLDVSVRPRHGPEAFAPGAPAR